MRRLTPSEAGEVRVAPRWPHDAVLLSDMALVQLQEAQRLLTPRGIQLVLTRGYEKRGPLNWAHGIARRIGAFCFRLLYPRRASEHAEIFSPNGHDHCDGNAIDVSVIHHGKPLIFLPWGVFTPERTLRENRRRHDSVLTAVRSALEETGFSIHPNPTEALQIHCHLSAPFH
jgi:hypothetical protein